MSTSCSICLDTSKDPFTSKCNHSFCNKCILEWITQNDECPLCRTAISEPTRNKTVDEDGEDGEDEDRYQIYIDGNITENELDIVHERIEDFISSYDTNETYYKWKYNIYGSYLSVRNGDYFLDLFFKIHLHKHVQNCYIIIVKVSKRNMVKQSMIKQHNKHKKIIHSKPITTNKFYYHK
jgi:hypothetical protein